MLLAAGLTACSDGETSGPDAETRTVVDASPIETQRQAPVTDPCQWLDTAEVVQAMDRVGIGAEESDLRSTANPWSSEDWLAECWHQTADPGGRLVVTLISDEQAAARWLSNMEELAAAGGRDETKHGATRTLTRVAGAPAIQLEASPETKASCDVHAVVGDAAVVGIGLAGDQVSELDALCSETATVLERVVERLPEAS